MSELSAEIKRLKGPEDANKAYCCMTEVPTPWADALCLCRGWISRNLGQYIEGYHLEQQDGTVIGQLYYSPSERALFPYQIEPGVAVLYCEWVQRKHQHRGLGKRLFQNFLEEMRQAGMKGIVVEGTDEQGRMFYERYLERGFEILLEEGSRKLLYLSLAQPEISASRIQPRILQRRGPPVEVLILSGYICPFEAASAISLQEVASEFGDQVNLREIQLSPQTLREYGVARGIFINGRQKLRGGETEEAIRRAIMEELE